MRTIDRRNAFTFVEAIIAIAVLAVLVTALVDLFLTTQRGAAKTEEQLAGMLAAHAAGERLRARLDSNPGLLRAIPRGADGSWTIEHPAAELLPAVDGGPLADLARRLEALTVSIRIEDDVDLEPEKAEQPLTALVKFVKIAVVSDTSNRAVGRLQMRLLAPVDSLDDDAVDALYRAHHVAWPIEAMWQNFATWAEMSGVVEMSDASPIKIEYRRMLADAFHLVCTANAGSFVITGARSGIVPNSYQLPAPGFEPRPVEKVQDLTAWAEELAGANSPHERRMHTAAYTTQVLSYLLGSHRAAPAAVDLMKKMRQFLQDEGATLQELTTRVKRIHDAHVQLKRLAGTTSSFTAGIGSPLDAAYENLYRHLYALLHDPEMQPGGRLWQAFYVVFSLWKTMDGYTPHRAQLDRMTAWPERCVDAMADAEATLHERATDTSSPAHQRASAALELAHVAQLRMLATRGGAVDAKSRLKGAAATIADRDLAAYLSTNDAHDITSLSRRHARFSEDFGEVAQLGAGGSGEAPLVSALKMVESDRIATLCRMWLEICEGPPARPGTPVQID
jgi:type II secretory pathway pseudopilin PulG